MTLIEKNNGLFNASSDLKKISEHFIHAFPVMTRLEQKIALALYRLLLFGEPVLINTLSKEVNQTEASIDKVLQSWPGLNFDEDNKMVGFWGLTIHETNHHLKVNDKNIYTWCAWDTLFIPELLNTTVQITSHCALSGDKISLTISPEGIEHAQPDSNKIMVSFLVPGEEELKENIITSFCYYVFFFRSRKDGELWMADHPNTFLLTLNEAFAIGKKMNTTRYNLTLY